MSTAPAGPETRHVSSDDLDWQEIGNGGRVEFRCKRLGLAAGGGGLGCSLVEVQPGRRSWPYHYHHANDEALYVLAGRGRLRTPGGERPLRPGDYAGFPRGAGGAHQVLADGDELLRYLCFSTMLQPEIAVYPDSGKLGLFAGRPPGADPGPDDLVRFVPGDARVEYFAGEE